MEEQENNKEKIQPFNFRGEIVCFRPGGNDTALIINGLNDPQTRRRINSSVMQIYPDIEQVGFVSQGTTGIELNMAGGEFCGNATRSTAFLALGGKPGEFQIKVSGVDGLLKAGVTISGEAYAEMPVFSDPEKVKVDTDFTGVWIVEMEGITHNVICDPREIDKIKKLSPGQIKNYAFEIIQKKGLNLLPAAGVIFAEQNERFWSIIPVVYVRDVDTLFLETACGSGTCALGQVLAKMSSSSVNKIPIIQPSGEVIKISIQLDENGGFTQALISGPVKKLSEGIIRTDKEGVPFVIERINKGNLTEFIAELITLYKNVFSQAPYFEKFTDEEVEAFFKEYVEKGIILLARNEKGVVGFSTALPLETETKISELFAQAGVNPQDTAYIAELGVGEKYRRKGIGQALIEELLLSLKESCVLLRTNVDNNKAINLYEKLGFTIVKEVKQTIERPREENNSLSDERIFLIKNL